MMRAHLVPRAHLPRLRDIVREKRLLETIFQLMQLRLGERVTSRLAYTLSLANGDRWMPLSEGDHELVRWQRRAIRLGATRQLRQLERLGGNQRHVDTRIKF